MKNIKLYGLLKSLSKNEFIKLKSFVASPVYNTNKSINLFYDYLTKNYDNVMDGKQSKYEIYSGIFGKEKFNEGKYWKITSAFASLVDKFLIYCEYDKDTYYQKNLLLESYRSRNIHKQYSALSKEIQKSFDSEFNKGLNFFLNQTHYYFQNISYLGSGYEHNLEGGIEKLFENLRMFFIMTNVISVSIISNIKSDFIDNSASKLWLFGDTLDYLTKNKSYIKKNYITVYIFFLIILSKIYPEEEKHYFEVKKIISKNREKFSANLFRHMLINILDYSVYKLIKGDEKFLKEIFFINRLMDENSLTLFGEHILGEYYYSVIEHATMLNQNSWAEDFAEKYKDYLKDEQQNSAFSLAIARIYFENNDYNSSLQYLLNVENINPYFYLSHKILLLQNNYELGNLDSLPFILETLSKYLKRRIDISAELKDNYIRFLYYFRKFRTITTSKIYLIDNYEKELHSEKFFLQKNWIIEKYRVLNAEHSLHFKNN